MDVVEFESQSVIKKEVQGYLLPATMSIEFLVIFAQAHDEFRIPELLSVAELHRFAITFPEAPEERDCKRPFMVLKLDEEEHARTLASRCILIKYFHTYATTGSHELMLFFLFQISVPILCQGLQL